MGSQPPSSSQPLSPDLIERSVGFTATPRINLATHGATKESLARLFGPVESLQVNGRQGFVVFVNGASVTQALARTAVQIGPIKLVFRQSRPHHLGA